MADIAAGDVVHTVTKKVMQDSGLREISANIVFGNGVLTYPAGGVPLTKAQLGLPVVLETVHLVDPSASDGFLYKYDKANEKIRIYQGDNNNAADAPLIELVAATATPAATTLKVLAVGY